MLTSSHVRHSWHVRHVSLLTSLPPQAFYPTAIIDYIQREWTVALTVFNCMCACVRACVRACLPACVLYTCVLSVFGVYTCSDACSISGDDQTPYKAVSRRISANESLIVAHTAVVRAGGIDG